MLALTGWRLGLSSAKSDPFYLPDLPREVVYPDFASASNTYASRQLNMNELKSALVLITGANTGIGYATAKALLQSERPYHVLLGGRDEVKARQAAADLQTELGSDAQVSPIQIDVESDKSIDKAYAGVATKYGRLDGLINNAGKPLMPLQCIKDGF